MLLTAAARVLPAALVVVACAAIDLAAFVDARLYTLGGVHAWGAAVREALANAEFKRQLALGPPLWWRLALWFALVVVIEAALYVACARLATRASAKTTRRARFVVWATLAASATVALAGRGAIASLAASPTSIVGLVPAHDLVFRHAPPAPMFTRAYPRVGGMPRLGRTPSILFVVVESLRADALGPTLMPRLDAFARAHGCIRPAHHYSSSHVTELAIFSLLYGLDGYDLAPFAGGVVDSFPLALLRANGYRVAGASASTLRHWAQSDFMLRQFDPYAEPDGRTGWQRDVALAAWARRFYATFDARTPSFLFLFFDATHVDYSYPPRFAVETPALDDDWLQKIGVAVADVPPALRAPMQRRYRNSVRFVDDAVGALLEERAAALAAGTLAVVVVGDHGEAFWEHGAWGHVGAPTDPAAIEVPLIACLPGAAAPAVETSRHADVMPTLIDYLKPSPPIAAAQFSSGRSLLGAPAADADCALVTPKAFWSERPELYVVAGGARYWLRAGANKKLALARVTDVDDRPLPSPPSLPACVAAAAARFGAFLQ
ncbi:MAG TPA: sulfatase-like hydrolase/transferase [Polyangia bacterium]